MDSLKKREIKGKKLYCQAHKIVVRKRAVISRDGHHEDTAKLNNGLCRVEKNFEWDK